MIANITKGGFLKPLIEYNEKKINKKEAQLLSYENIISNSNDNNGYQNAINLMSSLGYNSKRKDKFFHVSLNFPENDKEILDDNLLKNLANDYMQNMGFIDVPFVVYKHEDTNHPHIHIVTSNINYQKKAISTSNDRRESQKISRDLELKYNLTVISSKKEINKEKIVDQNKFNSLREELNYHIKFALQKYRVQNLTDFQSYLNQKNLDIEIVKGIKENSNGSQMYEGIIFNKFDTTFKQQQKGIKASSLYLKPTLKNLEKSFSRNVAYHKENRKSIRNQIDFLLSPYNSISIEDFKKKLLNKDIELKYKYDSKFNLVGLSFVNTKTGYKYTGEQIGKKYTAKNLSLILNNKTELKPTVLTSLNYNRYFKNLEHLDINKKIQSLISLGFKVQYQEKTLFISDYKNKSNEGYIKLISGIENNPMIIDLYKNSKKIEFNNLTTINKLHFEYNRSIFDKDNDKTEQILNKLSAIENPSLNKNEELKNNIKNILDELYQDVYYYQNQDNTQNNGIADVDKKTKKQFKRKR